MNISYVKNIPNFKYNNSCKKSLFFNSPTEARNIIPHVNPTIIGIPQATLCDLQYRERISEDIGLDNVHITDLQCIAAPREFKSVIIENNRNPNFYIPGKRPEDKRDIPDSYGLENVEDNIFGASLHVHTTASDGEMSVQELLDTSVKYADIYKKNTGKNFYLGITDHNTVQGCKEAVQIIAKNPQKYKNIKLVLGLEISTVEDEIGQNKPLKPFKFHILAMCINPFDKNLNEFLDFINEGRKNPMFPQKINIQNAVDGLQNQPDCHICFAHPAYPNIKHKLPDGADYLAVIKDCIKHFKNIAGKKALYAESYYGGYYGDVATDELLHSTILSSCIKNGLYNAGGIDCHGKSIFYNDVKLKKEKKKKI